MNDHTPQDDRPGEDADLAALLRRVGRRPTPAADVTAKSARPSPPDGAQRVPRGAARNAGSRSREARLGEPVAVVAAVAVASRPAALESGRRSGRDGGRVTGAAELRHSADGTWQSLTATYASGRVGRGPYLGLPVESHCGVQTDSRCASTRTRGWLLPEERTPASRQAASTWTPARPARAVTHSSSARPYGDVRHVGTQYVASVHDGVLRVTVREGSIAIDRGQRAGRRPCRRITRGAPGRQRGARADRLARRDVALGAAVAPEFTIEGRSLDEFLGRGRPGTGRKIVYTSADAAPKPSRRRLKGSTSGLRRSRRGCSVCVPARPAPRNRGRPDPDRARKPADAQAAVGGPIALGYHRGVRPLRWFGPTYAGPVATCPLPRLEYNSPARSRRAGRDFVLLGALAAHAAAPYRGRPVDAVLGELAATGEFQLVYTSAVVPSSAKVAVEPTAGPAAGSRCTGAQPRSVSSCSVSKVEYIRSYRRQVQPIRARQSRRQQQTRATKRSPTSSSRRAAIPWPRTCPRSTHSSRSRKSTRYLGSRKTCSRSCIDCRAPRATAWRVSPTCVGATRTRRW